MPWLRVSHRLQSRCWVGLWSHQKAQLGNPLPSSLIRCWMDSASCGLWDWGLSFSWVISWRSSLVLHMGFSIKRLATWQLASSEKANKKSRGSTREKMKITVFYNLTMEWYPITFTILRSLEETHWSTCRWANGMTQGSEHQEGGIFGRPVRSCLLQKLLTLGKLLQLSFLIFY